MGCISSKEENPAAAAAETPLPQSPPRLGVDRHLEVRRSKRDGGGSLARVSSVSSASVVSSSFAIKVGYSHHRHVDAEQVAAGWPPWLCTAAGEAIHGWIPLRADCFTKLEKIGQGTYSSVFRAREVATGRMVALKKVRFDNFQPESVRFMAREIQILRRLDHPNIMKLEGLITSGSSNSIYLVFEYMEHDLAGLVSSPDIKFSEAQVKCYMRQLLSAVEHCHLRGIIHRDIKVSNILVNNEGVLKLGDFGLANIVTPKNKHSLTSRVVTLWYRPPELLMGSTSYGVTVDLWSVGCVFAELYLGKPVLKGRTEVEQLHKIFKLCGSPPEDYWKKSKLPHATMFKPQHPYESSLRERCKDVPTTAVELIETFLSVEPYKRGTASSALMSRYFRTQPFACDPSSLPRYPPTKEMDAKSRDDAQKRKPNNTRHPVAARKPRRTRKTLQQQALMSKLSQKEDGRESTQGRRAAEGQTQQEKAAPRRRDSFKPSFDTVSESIPMVGDEGGDSAFSGPVAVSASSGFAWAVNTAISSSGRRKDDTTSLISDKSQFSMLDPGFAKGSYGLSKPGNKSNNQAQDQEVLVRVTSKRESRKPPRNLSHHHHHQYHHHHHRESSDFVYQSPEITQMGALPKSLDFENDEENHMEFSAPLLVRPHRMDDRIRHQAARKSRFEREK